MSDLLDRAGPHAAPSRKSNGLIVGVDASNLRQGGGRTHLIELLHAASPLRDGFDRIIVWGSKSTLALIGDRPWLIKQSPAALDGALPYRILWQLYSLPRLARAICCDVLLAPGGLSFGGFRPTVTMSRNLLPFELSELLRYGLSPLTLKFLTLRLLQSQTFRRSQGLIFLSRYAQDVVSGILGKFNTPTAMIPHGVSLRFSNSAHESIFDPFQQNSIIRLLYVSTIEPYKHQIEVVRGVRNARDRTGLNIQLDLIGPAHSPSLRALQRTISTSDPSGKWTRYRGPLKYEELSDVYAAADIGVFASSCENFPNTLIEMMASGLPIVCSNRGPMPEILENDCIYFDPEDPFSISTAIERCLFDWSASQAMARRSCDRALRYSWDRCAADTFSFLTLIHRNWLADNRLQSPTSQDNSNSL